MNSYALTVVLKNDLDEKSRQEVLDTVTKKIGKVEKEEQWGVRDLAYPIKHQTKGYYSHYLFQADPQVAPQLNKSLKLQEDIIRFLLIKV